MKRVGFVINSRVPAWENLRRGMRPHHWLTGWPDGGSPMNFMRFGWVAGEVNRGGRMVYELYKPWRKYAAVVFLKSMGGECERLARRLQASGTKVIFEANVDYYTLGEGLNLPEDLVPTVGQRAEAVAMTEGADAVIASSRRLAEICSGYGPVAVAVADNILPGLVPAGKGGSGWTEGRLNLWWSGMASKLYDFLLIREVLERLPVHLHWVTGDWEKAVGSWPEDRLEEFRDMLGRVKHTFYVYRGIPALLRKYHEGGGLIVSPRYMDSPYNQSHTEWKVTLGLVCGLGGLASALPSYVDAAEVSGGQLRICGTAGEWGEALERWVGDYAGNCDGVEEGRRRILGRYGTPAVAKEHERVLEELLS